MNTFCNSANIGYLLRTKTPRPTISRVVGLTWWNSGWWNGGSTWNWWWNGWGRAGRNDRWARRGSGCHGLSGWNGFRPRRNVWYFVFPIGSRLCDRRCRWHVVSPRYCWSSRIRPRSGNRCRRNVGTSNRETRSSCIGSRGRNRGLLISGRHTGGISRWKHSDWPAGWKWWRWAPTGKSRRQCRRNTGWWRHRHLLCILNFNWILTRVLPEMIHGWSFGCHHDSSISGRSLNWLKRLLSRMSWWSLRFQIRVTLVPDHRRTRFTASDIVVALRAWHGCWSWRWNWRPSHGLAGLRQTGTLLWYGSQRTGRPIGLLDWLSYWKTTAQSTQRWHSVFNMQGAPKKTETRF